MVNFCTTLLPGPAPCLFGFRVEKKSAVSKVEIVRQETKQREREKDRERKKEGREREGE